MPSDNHFGATERMSRILAISSQVACGHVGLSAIVPAVQAMAHEVIALPTVILSNHPGHQHVAGERISANLLHGMVDALNANGWLKGINVILTGYLPTPEHVAFAGSAVAAVKSVSTRATYICDPILGDKAEGLYLDAAAAATIRDELLPLADVALPNQFELAWLTGRSVESLDEAAVAAAQLPTDTTFVTSVPSAAGEIANLLRTGSDTAICRHRQLPNIPKGTGDFLSGIFAADPDLARTTGRVSALVEASRARDHLAIAEARDTWLGATAPRVERL